MGEYEPRDSRIVTQNPSATPGEPERTGPREDETRAKGEETLPADKDASKKTEERWQVADQEQRGESPPDGGEE